MPNSAKPGTSVKGQVEFTKFDPIATESANVRSSEVVRANPRNLPNPGTVVRGNPGSNTGSKLPKNTPSLPRRNYNA